jgi:hypothetical protein
VDQARGHLPLLGASLVAALLVACDGQRAGRGIDASGGGATWRWRAERMDVSALSTPMVDPSGAPAILDVRLSFFDEEGDEAKAVGALSVAVLLDSTTVGRQSADLEGRGGHARSWDAATRTYSLRIPLSQIPAPGRVTVVQATFEGVDGARMTASREVRWPERPR